MVGVCSEACGGGPCIEASLGASVVSTCVPSGVEGDSGSPLVSAVIRCAGTGGTGKEASPWADELRILSSTSAEESRRQANQRPATMAGFTPVELHQLPSVDFATRAEALRQGIWKTKIERDDALAEGEAAKTEADALEKRQETLAQLLSSRGISWQAEAQLKELELRNSQLIAAYNVQVQRLQEELMVAAAERSELERRLAGLLSTVTAAKDQRGQAGCGGHLSIPQTPVVQGHREGRALPPRNSATIPAGNSPAIAAVAGQTLSMSSSAGKLVGQPHSLRPVAAQVRRELSAPRREASSPVFGGRPVRESRESRSPGASASIPTGAVNRGLCEQRAHTPPGRLISQGSLTATSAAAPQQPARHLTGHSPSGSYVASSGSYVASGAPARQSIPRSVSPVLRCAQACSSGAVIRRPSPQGPGKSVVHGARPLLDSTNPGASAAVSIGVASSGSRDQRRRHVPCHSPSRSYIASSGSYVASVAPAQPTVPKLQLANVCSSGSLTKQASLQHQGTASSSSNMMVRSSTPVLRAAPRPGFAQCAATGTAGSRGASPQITPPLSPEDKMVAQLGTAMVHERVCIR